MKKIISTLMIVIIILLLIGCSEDIKSTNITEVKMVYVKEVSNKNEDENHTISEEMKFDTKAIFDINGNSLVVIIKDLNLINDEAIITMIQRQQEAINAVAVYILTGIDDIDDIDSYHFLPNNYTDKIVLIYTNEKKYYSRSDMDEFESFFDVKKEEEEKYIKVVESVPIPTGVVVNLENSVLNEDVDLNIEVNETLEIKKDDLLITQVTIENKKDKMINKILIHIRLSDETGNVLTEIQDIKKIEIESKGFYFMTITTPSIINGVKVAGISIVEIEYNIAKESKYEMSHSEGGVLFDGISIKNVALLDYGVVT